VLHLIFVSMPYAAYISFLAAATAVGALLLRLLLQTIPSDHIRMHALSGVVGGVVLVHTLTTQIITGSIPLTQLTLGIVGAGVIIMSRGWFIGFLAVAITTWGVISLSLVPIVDVVIPGISVIAAAAFSGMIHVVRRRTNVRAEQLRLVTESQKQALQKALESEEQQLASLSRSQSRLRDTMSDLQSAKGKLERREKELSKTVTALTEAKKQAEESSRIKSAMLANMSHEVRTPLTAIIGFGEILEEESTGESGHFARLIVKSSHRLMETLDSVLKLSRLEANKVNLDHQKIDLVEEARAIILEQSNRSEQANVQLELESMAPTCFCYLDPGAIQRILRNLVGNAIKFTDAGGGVTVRVGHCGHPPTDSEAVRSGGQVHVLDDPPERADHAVLQVEDNGIGMSDEFQNDMFEAFHQESRGLNRSHEGSGLGLSITHRLVELMDSDIYVGSTKGEGTTFTLYFPKNIQEEARNRLGDAPSRSESDSETSFSGLETELSGS
jgi:signal transduction histidine kinase